MKLGNLGMYTLDELRPKITPQHEKWITKDEVYSPEAIKFAAEQLGKPDRDRTKSFSASGLGYCMRQQQFGWLGVTQKKFSPRQMEIFHTGDMLHLKWQMAGITAGWLAQAEVPVPQPNPYGLKGTMDGVTAEGDVLEIKSINSFGFKSVVAFGPKPEHKLQGDTYMLVSERPRTIFIYENKDTGDFIEQIRERTSETDMGVITRVLTLREAMEEKKLLPMLDDCKAKKGVAYNFCPYRDRCPAIKNFEQAEEQGS